MDVRAKKRASPRKSPNVQPVPATPYGFPSPIRGWVLDENLASAQPGGASILDNWVCTQTGVRVRGGRALYATLDGPVGALFAYRSGTETLFAASETAVYDVTVVADPEVAPTADITGLTSSDWSAEPFGTVGGDFLYIVNGADDAQLFDGATWVAVDAASTPAITGVATADLSHVWSFGNRLWFVEKGTMSAWYLPVDQIGGAAVAFSLSGVFRKGGTLLFGSKWSMDAGDGLDDKCVFVSSEGEVAVYEGTNPASAADWRLAGRYDMPRPLGKLAVVGAGGDLLIATEAGLIPISAAVTTDLGAVETKAVSGRITPYWQRQATLYPTGWKAKKFSQAGYMVVTARDGTSCMVVNLTTGAWSRFTGWDVISMEEFGGRGYFGSDSGEVFRMEAGGSDNGEIYTAVYLGLHDGMGAYGANKTVTQMRATFRFSTPFRALISATADFSQAVSSPPSAVPDTTSDVWDIGLWDVAFWDGGGGATATQAVWSSVGVSGTFIAPEVQITMGGSVAPQIELAALDAMFHGGAVVA